MAKEKKKNEIKECYERKNTFELIEMRKKKKKKKRKSLIRRKDKMLSL